MAKQTKQHTLWLLAAVSAPLAHFSGCGWWSALLTAVVILPLILLPKCWEGMSRALTLIQLLWLGAVAGLLLQNSAVYWPSDQEWVVPATLLALAAFTSKRSAPRNGAILAFCIGLLALPVATAGAAGVELQWLHRTSASWPTALALVLLLPALPAAGEDAKLRRSIWVSLCAVLPAALVQGTISPQVAAIVPDPLYQTARTLGYLEPVVAVGMTLGWYAMTAFLLHSTSEIAKNSDISRVTAYVLPVGTAAGVLLLKWQPDAQKCLIMSVFLWVLIPFLTKIKKSKKDEKRC